MTRPDSVKLPVHLSFSASGSSPLPAIVAAAGAAAAFAWDEFFTASIRNAHTRRAYGRAVRRFLDWLEPYGIPLPQITPAHVGHYFDSHPGSPPTRKLHLAALRGLFDRMVTRHVMVLNPAASVRGERYQVVEGKTPEMPITVARTLIASIRTVQGAANGPDLAQSGGHPTAPNLVGLRDRAVIATLIYTAARAGAVAKLRLKHFAHDGTQWTLRFDEKGGKSREIPVRHDLQAFILDYLLAAGIGDAPRDTPLFRTANRKTGRLTELPMNGIDVWRMVKRRLKAAGLSERLSPHSFRVMTVTDLLTQGVPLEDVQYLAGHSDPRTTRLYDRRKQRVGRNTVERISV